nr:acrosomal protein KIAA1210 homolog isoform X1 [Zonotrichia albicollis]
MHTHLPGSTMAGFYGCLKSENEYIMATRPTEVTQSPGDTVEECTGKKKSKFQTFKNFFAKKKRKEPPAPRGESNLKPCQSSSDVSLAVLNTAALHSPGEAGPKGSMGNKALSHDSVFILESAPGNVTGDVLSQENRPGRVRTLQLQLQQNVKLGSPPLVITGKKLEDAGAVSEDDGLPRSPPEISTLHEVLTDSPNKSSNPVQRHSSLSLGGTDSEDEQIPSGASSRPISPSSSGTPGAGGSSSLPVDFTTPASPLGCLDTSAARHRIAINPRRQRGFTNKHLLPLQVKQLENETCLPAAPERKGNSTELLESGKHKSDGEGNEDTGLPAQVGPCAKGGCFKETPGVKSSSDAAPESCGPPPVAEDPCALLQEHGSLPGVRHPYKGATLLLRPEPSPVNLQGHHGAGVMCSADGSAHESKMHPQSTSAEAPALPELQQLEGEAAVSPDIPTADSFSSGVETSGLDILPDVAQSSSVNSVDLNIKAKEKGDPLFSGKEELCFGTAGNHSSHAVSDAPQAAVADAESCSDIKTGADLRSEKSSVAKNGKETCEIMEFQLSKDSVEKKIDPAASVSEAVCVVPCSKLEACSKAEMVPVPKNNQGSQQGNTSCVSGKLSIGCLASSSLAGLKSNISSDAVSKEHQVSTAASHRKAAEGSQSSNENVKTPLKTASARPVRFTIAPAWQRSLSGGSNSKEDSYSRSSPTSPIRPEFFEGMTKEPSRFDAALQESAKTNSETFDRDCKDRDLHLNSFMEWADHETQNFESPFGVRLRRTSSLLKYQNESRVKPLKLLPPAAPAAASASVKEDQKLMGTGKPPPSLPIHTKSVVKKPDLLEDKNPAKARSEEVAKKQNGYKPSEKVSPYLETASSEPAWVSMAKLKRKGFQDHPLAKERKDEDKALAKVDQGQPGLCAGANTLKKKMPPSSQDKKTQRRTGVSAAAGKVGPMSQEASVVPAVGKEARHSPNLPMTPCSPAEPPWLSLAKKKAKAWSEMPQIVQ